MAFDGSGTFNRPVPSYIFDTVISETSVNAEMDGISAGLSNCVTRDGQSVPTANLPMASFRHTGVADASARTDYASGGQVQDGKLNWVVAGGTADALTAAYAPILTALVDGQLCFVRAASANATTTPTFSPNGLTAHAITKLGGSAVAIGEWSTDQELILRYKLASTRWELLNPTSARMAANTIKGNNTGSTANAADLTLTQARTMLVGPYFQARLSAAQSLTGSTLTKVIFDTEDYDSNNNYDTTNYRFQPTVAGVYRVRANVLGGAASFAASSGIAVHIKKNGTTYVAMGQTSFLASNVSNTAMVETMITFNGSTDYVEGWVISSGTTPTVIASNGQGQSEADSYFAAQFIGP